MIAHRQNEPGKALESMRPCCEARRANNIITEATNIIDDRPISVFGATRDGDTEIDWAEHQPPESDIRTARTGILSSLLFSRSRKARHTP